MDNYSELLKDERWLERKAEIIKRDHKRCACCFDNKSQLHVHHKVYHEGHYPWEYTDDELITLCVHCHRTLHGIQNCYVDKCVTFKSFKCNTGDESYTVIAFFNDDVYCVTHTQERFRAYGNSIKNIIEIATEKRDRDLFYNTVILPSIY